MTPAEFGDTVLSAAVAADRSCHAAIPRCRHRLYGSADCAGRRRGAAAQRMPGDGQRARRARSRSALRRVAAKPEEVAITYVGHSTYYIDTPGGVRIATDFNGYYRTGRLPDIVTMNRAHSTHYTLFPDPKIQHVLHGWGKDGQPAHIGLRVGDVYIRNVRQTFAVTMAKATAARSSRAATDLHFRARRPLHRSSWAPAPETRESHLPRSAGSIS